MTTVETSPHEDLLEGLLADVEAYKPDVDRDLIRRAFLFAEKAHEGQKRRSGEDFIHHPIGAARILAELHLDEATIASALLHDTVEDTGVSIDDISSSRA
jgi:GTP pyrophosphokinase